MTRFILYPPLEPYQSGFLKPDDIHEVYWEECGNPNGIPVVFLHGGPGAGCSPMHRRFFDPQLYRIILFDQRGCGRSKPNACIENNTTDDLITDMEAIRKMLSISNWIVFGGSWGSTLALAYAQRFSENCLALVLRGIFLGRERELDWFFDGVKNLYPEEQKKLVDFLPEEERPNLLENYYKRLSDPDPKIHQPAATIWAQFEASCVCLEPDKEAILASASTEADLAISRLEAHYMYHDLFLKQAPLLENMHKIKDIPGYIVQGRYDAICPPITAWELHQQWPASELIMLNDAGHSSSEKSIQRNLIKIMEQLKFKFQ